MNIRSQLCALTLASCLTTLHSIGAMAGNQANSMSNVPLNYTLDTAVFQGPECEGTLSNYGTVNACRLPSGTVPKRIQFSSASDYSSLCALDKDGFIEFCLLGSLGMGRPLLDNASSASGWGFVKFIQFPFSIEKFEYGPGFSWIELYSDLDLQGDRLCVMILTLGSTQQACNGIGRQARSAKIFGFYFNYDAKYEICLRTPQDEANRCFYHNTANTLGEFSVMNIDSKNPPEGRVGVRAKGDKISGSLYSVDYLKTR
ncbi:hypothetical protein [Pseudomonas carassii]|uniref:Secreted protein n=1 Tax=Pseudomonas carassii TaxID=3115855 RepID=A0ABU7HEJ0_9PSED|nr:hypothetical protein [Pseudomonas sp. 137P]MEE1889036.1 hypothetical protein [Pseudomonas sp. 137P]